MQFITGFIPRYMNPVINLFDLEFWPFPNMYDQGELELNLVLNSGYGSILISIS